MTIDEAIDKFKDSDTQLSDWLSELKDKRRILNDYKKLFPMIISGFDKFFTEWEPCDKENLFPYESSLILSYENIKKMYDSMCKSSLDKDD